MVWVLLANARMFGGFRPDLEGLRGLAVLLVVLFHARLTGFSGGFVGVDVFLVLSGYLITGLLLREHVLSGSIDLAAFYARRAGRILPAATLVILTTLAASAFVVAPLDRGEVAVDGAAAALFLGNLRFAAQAVDYFASTPSPFQHFWSLGVEEQFYLLWPVLLIVGSHLGRQRMSLIVGAVFISSLALALLITPTDAVSAFYGLHTRAWQLALGALLAVHAPLIARVPWRLSVSLGWVGLAALVLAVATIEPLTPYPGVAALLPTFGVALIIAARGDGCGPAWLLRQGPLRILGRISYSLYLWHWPVLVLAEIGAGRELDLAARLGLAGLSVLLAIISWRFVEEPFRRGRLIFTRPRLTVSLGGSSVAATAGLAVLLNLSTGLPSAAAVPQATLSAAVVAPAVVVSDLPVDPKLGSQAAATSAPLAEAPDLAAIPSAGPLTPALRTQLGAARRDSDRLNERGCGLSLAGDRPPRCLLGASSGSTTVALVGDSHAAQWFPLLEALADEKSWTIAPFTKDSCTFLDLRIVSIHLRREYSECAVWRERVIASLEQLRPDLVFVASSRWVHPVDARANNAELFGSAMARLLVRIPGRVVIIGDTPLMHDDVPACLSRHLEQIFKCATMREIALAGDYMVRDRVAAELSGARIIDPTEWLCDTTMCPAVIDGQIAYHDDHHLTATFVRSLAQLFAGRLAVADR